MLTWKGTGQLPGGSGVKPIPSFPSLPLNSFPCLAVRDVVSLFPDEFLETNLCPQRSGHL